MSFWKRDATGFKIADVAYRRAIHAAYSRVRR